MFEPKPRSMFTRSALALALLLGACVDEQLPPDKDAEQLVQEDPSGEGVLALEHSFEQLRGSYEHPEGELRFEVERLGDAGWVTIELRGMVLSMTHDAATGAFDLDGFTLASGEDTQMRAPDRAMLQALDGALAQPLSEAEPGSAMELLGRATTAWGDYSDTLPLQRTYFGELQRSAGLCGSLNKPGQGTSLKYIAGTHDCNSGAGDCSNWTGCDHWDDNSTTDRVVMSMHPGGSCSDDTYFGGSATTMSCFEPDHPGGKEYAYGACFGRCGAGCGSGTQFTRACLDHDQCVRLGHSIASLWCDDHLVDATWDAINASDCSGANFSVDYNWAGSSREGSCPDSWRNANDGCDHGCQWVDGDCFR